MKIAILGFDVEGRASYEYFSKQDHEITICDRNPDTLVPASTNSVLGDEYLDNLDRFDLLIRTAGMEPRKILEKNPNVASKITTHVNEFFKHSPTKNIIGVTGTKGKGTTSTLITKMLEASSKSVFLGGNIGVPPLSFLSELNSDSWVVLELASFQLIDLKHSPYIGVCLMVVPEHLNWHANLEEYVTAKSQLFVHQNADDVAIYFAGNLTSKQIASFGDGSKIPYYDSPGAIVDNGTISIDSHSICKTSEIRLLGEHNWQNVCAAVTAIWQVSNEIEAIRSVLTSFAGLEHRLEFVREVNGVQYYDDSFGTAPETAIVAMQAFDRPIVMILGGSIKGASFEELAEKVTTSNVKYVVIIGNTTNPDYKPSGPHIEAALKSKGFNSITSLVKPNGPSMDEVVQTASSFAEPGDIVLLSAASASFDIFTNYKQRGELFKQAVQSLA
jgi:UDP-N-acetylmuramoylalanine--D-glutamate ligase